MKHGLRLTLKEKELLTKEGYNPNNFLRVKKTAESYEFLEIYSGKILTVRR